MCFKSFTYPASDGVDHFGLVEFQLVTLLCGVEGLIQLVQWYGSQYTKLQHRSCHVGSSTAKARITPTTWV